jgi:hypothetical protein
VSGTVRASDPDVIDSVWVTVDSQQHGIDGGFGQTFSAPYRFVIPAGQQPGTHLPMSFRARDVAAFATQRDTYVVVVP